MSDDYLCKTPIPDYLNDLNAMHEAEELLNEDQMDSYILCLSRMKNDVHHGRLAFRATAAKRAEAFLKTLNIWEE